MVRRWTRKGNKVSRIGALCRDRAENAERVEGRCTAKQYVNASRASDRAFGRVSFERYDDGGSGKCLKCSCTAGAERTNTGADSGRAKFCAADQTVLGSTRCRIYMSKRFIVQTENRTMAGRGNGCGSEETFLCARRFFFSFPTFFIFIFFVFVRYRLPVWICAEVRKWRRLTLSHVLCVYNIICRYTDKQMYLYGINLLSAS